MSKVQVDKVVNLSDDGAPQLTYGAALPVGYGLTGAGGLNITGVVTAASAVFSGNVTIGGSLTYEDVTNIDVVGVSTFAGRMNVNSSALFNEGLSVTAGVTTIAGTSTFAKATTVNATLTASEGIHVSAGVATFAGAVSTGALTVTGATNVNSGHVNVDAGYSFQWGDSHERIEQSDGNIEFFTANGEKMRLAGSNLGIGITNPDTILHIKASNPYATIQASSDGGECGVHFEDDDGNVDGKITYRTDYTGNTDNYMRFYTAQTNALEINSDQEVLPQSHLRIKDSKALYLGNSNDFTLWHDATDSRIRYNHSAGSLKFQLNDNTTIGMFDTSGRLLMGATAARDVGGLSSQKLVIEGTDGPSSALSLIDNQNSAGGSPSLCFAKSRGTSVGSNTIVQDGDTLGAITWCAADGNDIANQSAKIYCNVDAAPGSNDTAGRLIFSTSADGSSSPASRLEINKDGYVYVKTGNIVMSTSGTGIDFSATGGPDAGATGSSELLDDYEEGSWSGVVMDGGSTNISINNVVARYVKIGQYVHCYFNITRNETGSRSGTVQFWQLPFTALNSTMQVCGTFWLDEGGVTNGDSVGGAIYIHSNTNNAQFVHPTTDAQQSANRYLQYSEWSQPSPIYGSFSYMTQD